MKLVSFAADKLILRSRADRLTIFLALARGVGTLKRILALFPPNAPGACVGPRTYIQLLEG